MKSADLVGWLDRRWYPGVSTQWDDHMLRDMVVPQLSSAGTVLDLGAGSGRVAAMNFKSLARYSVGLDVDPAIAANRQIDGGCIGRGECLPFRDAVFDVVVADNVLEHLEDPAAIFREVHRVLKPGGRFFIKTPNAWHYVPIIARLTSQRVHQRLNRLRGRAAVDTFPTMYRANTTSALRRLASAAGLQVRFVKAVEGRPEYLRIHPLAYCAGFVYERLVNRFSAAASLRVVLLAEFQRLDQNV